MLAVAIMTRAIIAVPHLRANDFETGVVVRRFIVTT
jgi:hypothetical protein